MALQALNISNSSGKHKNLEVKKEKKEKHASYFKTLTKVNSDENFKTTKALIKLANRSFKVGLTISETQKPFFIFTALFMKELRHVCRFMHSVVTVGTADKKLKFIDKTKTKNQPTFQVVQNYFKNFLHSFLFGSCEERRRLVKAGLSMVMMGALSTHLAYQVGTLDRICKDIWGEEEGSVYATMFLMISAESIRTWQICRRLLLVETIVHKCLTPSDTEKKKQKLKYSSGKGLLLGGRYLCKIAGSKPLEKLFAIGSAIIPFYKPAKPKAKSKEKGLETDVAKEKGKKDKKDKFDKVKPVRTGWVAQADQTTRLVITLLLCYQFYYFMTLFTNPWNQKSDTEF